MLANLTELIQELGPRRFVIATTNGGLGGCDRGMNRAFEAMVVGKIGTIGTGDLVHHFGPAVATADRRQNIS